MDNLLHTPAGIFSIFGFGVAMTLVIGFYCVLVTRNLIRALIGLEILTKGVTLLLIVAGYVSKQVALAQSLAITLIVIEVAVIVVAVGVILSVYRNHGTIDVNLLRKVKG